MRGIHPKASIGLLLFASIAHAAPAATQPSAVDQVWQLLSDGKQSDAEHFILGRIESNDASAQEVFLLAVMTRSRFDVDEASQLLKVVVKTMPNTPESAAANAVIALDASGDSDAQFEVLRDLHKKHPENPAYAWLLAVECRACNHNEEGADAFEDLGKHFKVGPVLFHQTYANILDELYRYDESLPHRKLAVKLEPETWTYEGMGDTYMRMGRYHDAIEPFTQALELSPRSLRTLSRLIRAQTKAADHDGLLASSRKLVELRPGDAESPSALGVALMLNHSPKEAGEEFNKALAIAPGNATYRSYAKQAQAALHRAAATQAAGN